MNKKADMPALGRQDDSDRAILEKYFRGEDDAIGELVDRYAPRLYSFGLRMCGNSEDARDMVQDTFLNVVRYLSGFRGETKLKNWLYRIASSACIKKRRGKNEPGREISLEDVRPDQGNGPPADVPDWTSLPADELLNDELREVINEAVGRLPEHYRMVFYLRDVEGFSTQETADMMDISPEAVKTRLHRARAQLRGELAAYYQPAEGGSA
jgi:RNA polymerase sigma-70 factor (ECF subfamily)